MHTITQFLHSHRSKPHDFTHFAECGFNDKNICISYAQTYGHHLKASLHLNDTEVHVDACILGYELNDEWLLVRSATDFCNATTSRLINMETLDSRLLTNVRGGWCPGQDILKSDYRCSINFDQRTIHFTKFDTIITFKEIFQYSQGRFVESIFWKKGT